MPRPRKRRRLGCRPCSCYFKPRGIPLRHLGEEVLLADELEALKLHDVDGLDQTQGAKKMGISQPTFARTLNRAYQKLGRAIIKGKAIRIMERGCGC